MALEEITLKQEFENLGVKKEAAKPQFVQRLAAGDVCPICKDEGYVRVGDAYRPCVCAKRRQEMARIDKLFGVSQISKRFIDCTFDNYDGSINTEEFERCKAYAENPNPTGNGLFLMGPVGVGKTHLAISILKEKIMQGVPSLFQSVPDLLDSMRPNSGKSKGEVLDAVKSVNFLVLDDLGVEKMSEWVDERMYMIINARYEDMLPTVYTTNLDSDSLENQLGSRALSRIRSTCDILFLGGDDYRTKMKTSNKKATNAKK